MLQANMPYRFWSRACMYYTVVFAHSEDEYSPRDGKTPYVRLHGSEDPNFQAVPFGCQATFLLEKFEREKFAAPSSRGVMIGYAAHGGFQILELDAFLEDGSVHVRLTRDVRFDFSSFPLRGVPDVVGTGDVTWSLGRGVYSRVHALSREIDYKLRADGEKVCTRCNKLITDAEVTCAVCLKVLAGGSSEHGRGNPRSAGCLRARCVGHLLGLEQAFPPPGRKRLRGKQAVTDAAHADQAASDARAAEVRRDN